MLITYICDLHVHTHHASPPPRDKLPLFFISLLPLVSKFLLLPRKEDINFFALVVRRLEALKQMHHSHVYLKIFYLKTKRKQI